VETVATLCNVSTRRDDKVAEASHGVSKMCSLSDVTIDKLIVDYQLFHEFELSFPGRSLCSAYNIMSCEVTGEYMAPPSIDHTPVLEFINSRRYSFHTRRQLTGKNHHDSRGLIEIFDITTMKYFLKFDERIYVLSF